MVYGLNNLLQHTGQLATVTGLQPQGAADGYNNTANHPYSQTLKVAGQNIPAQVTCTACCTPLSIAKHVSSNAGEHINRLITGGHNFAPLLCPNAQWIFDQLCLASLSEAMPP
eukprot:GHRR01009062.1.p1 GENE.GHRR01009062.1~~GHRR01009062.1.p1  ORF type:complete len:113 (-),score=24.89 GHRR01009062.1:1004-1342(-)